MRARPILWLSLLFVISLFLLAYPVYVIRPFRHQGPRELSAALLITQYRPVFEILCAALAIFILVAAWSSVKPLRRTGLAVLTLFVIAFAALSRINVYEKMFHPLDQPTFSAAARTKLDPAEQVIAVHVNGSARAYPIRDISYHHIVNDTLAGRAIVATY